MNDHSFHRRYEKRSLSSSGPAIIPAVLSSGSARSSARHVSWEPPIPPRQRHGRSTGQGRRKACIFYLYIHENLRGGADGRQPPLQSPVSMPCETTSPVSPQRVGKLTAKVSPAVTVQIWSPSASSWPFRTSGAGRPGTGRTARAPWASPWHERRNRSPVRYIRRSW